MLAGQNQTIPEPEVRREKIPYQRVEYYTEEELQ